MAVKTFTQGEKLTYTDTNTYLNNGGLVYVKSQNVVAGSASMTVNDAFSSTYDAYKIVWTNGTASTNGELSLRLGASTTNYFGFLMYGTYVGTAIVGVNDNANTQFRFVGGFDASYGSLNVDIYNPFLTRVTTVTAQANYGAAAFGTYSGRHAETTSHTAFTLIPLTGTLQTGTITVYGYRKA